MARYINKPPPFAFYIHHLLLVVNVRTTRNPIGAKKAGNVGTFSNAYARTVIKSTSTEKTVMTITFERGESVSISQFEGKK